LPPVPDSKLTVLAVKVPLVLVMALVALSVVLLLPLVVLPFILILPPEVTLIVAPEPVAAVVILPKFIEPLLPVPLPKVAVVPPCVSKVALLPEVIVGGAVAIVTAPPALAALAVTIPPSCIACDIGPDCAVPPLPPATICTVPPAPVVLELFMLVVVVGSQILPVLALLELASNITFPPPVEIAVAAVEAVKSILPPAVLSNCIVTDPLVPVELLFTVCPPVPPPLVISAPAIRVTLLPEV